METNNLTAEKVLIQQRFSKALSSYNEHALAQQQIHQRLIQLLQETGRSSFDRVLEIGCGTGGFTQQLTTSCASQEWIVNDLCNECVTKVAACFHNQSWQYLPGDAEQLSFPGTFDMVASASVIQWFTSPHNFINKITSQLNSNGILLINTFGQNNLHEIKVITGKGLAYLSLEDVRNWISPSFDIIYLQDEEIELQFPTPLQVLQHLKYTGVTGTNTNMWTRSMLRNFCDEYLDRYSINSNVTLTYHPIYLLAIKK
jgi:malonyl-CoA O-methyltransferase